MNDLLCYVKRRWIFLLVIAIILILNLIVWSDALKKEKPNPIDTPVKLDSIIV
jgi:hypothetical protein